MQNFKYLALTYLDNTSLLTLPKWLDSFRKLFIFVYRKINQSIAQHRFLQCGGQRVGRLWGDSGSQEGDRIRAHGECLYRLFAHSCLANRADRSSAAGTNRTSTPSSNLSSLSLPLFLFTLLVSPYPPPHLSFYPIPRSFYPSLHIPKIISPLHPFLSYSLATLASSGNAHLFLSSI